VTLLDEVRKRDTYIGQFEVIAAISAFLSFPPEFFEGRPVQLWIDNSAGAIGCLIKGYSGKADCAKLVNAFHFVVASPNRLKHSRRALTGRIQETGPTCTTCTA
jgi:hypothetical protein